MTAHWIHPLTPDSLDQNFSTEASHIGGKAASLLLLQRIGLPVPTAWVLPIRLCEFYYAQDRTLPDGVIDEVWSAVHSHSPKTTARRTRWAIRSGAAVSMPGTLATVLHCSNREEIDQGIRRVLDSWMSPEAVIYRDTHQLHGLTGTAIIIQRMVDTEVAGVLFSQDPRGRRPKNLLIEATHGLGDQLVSGSVVGQRWCVDRETLQIEIESHPVSHSPLLSMDSLKQLARYGLQIETYLGQPADIEWGLCQGEWSFFQARTVALPGPRAAGFDPVTAIERQHILDLENQRLAEFYQQGEAFWVRHSLCENMPCPTPLTWSVMRPFMSGSGGLGRVYQQMGFSPSRQVCREGFLELIAGQVYASTRRQPDLYCTDFPFSFDPEELKRSPSSIDHAPQKFDLDRVGPWFLLRVPWIYYVIARTRRRVERLRHTVHADFQALLPHYHQWIQEEHSQPLNGLDRVECLEAFERRCERLLQDFAPQLMLPGVIGAAVFEQLRQELSRCSTDSEADTFCHHLLSQLTVPCLDSLYADLVAYHHRELPQSVFLERHGHRASEELELAKHNWSEQPDLIPNLPDFPSDQLSKREASCLEDDLRAFLERHHSLARFKECRKLLQDAWTLLPFREEGKQQLMRGYALLREAARSLAAATPLGDDTYFLSREEWKQFDPHHSPGLAARHRREWQIQQLLPHPAWIDERGLLKASMTPSPHLEELPGSVISGGQGQGTAWFPEHHPGESPPTDSVLVCSILPPHYISYFSNTVAIVVNQSALLSHGAILARQFGIPVISHPDATQKIFERDWIEIDADQCVVRITPQASTNQNQSSQ